VVGWVKNMSEEDSPPVVDSVADTLAPQLGSDQKFLAKGEVDIRRFTVISGHEMKFLMYGTIRATKSALWKTIMDSYPNWKISQGGRGRRDIIRMESVSRGGSADVTSEIEQPNIFARNIYNRGWKKKQLQKLGE